MLFSVLLSLYHKESPLFLRQSLTSIFTQTLLPIEVVLVEDGPLTDELYAVIKEFTSQHPELKVISLPTNRGLGKALNEGLKHCSYDLVARMDTDDIAKPDRFEKQLAIFLEHPEIDVVGAWIDEFEGEVSNVLSMRKVPEQHENILRFAKGRCPVNHPVVMFRRRGGWRYAVTEVRLQTLFYKMGFIGFFSLLKNVCIRLVTRLLPNGLRSLLYKRLIRG